MRSLVRQLRGWARRWRDRGSDEYIRWLLSVHGGFLAPGNIRAFEHALRHMPEGGAVVEIGSFLGLSTNILVYLTVKHQRSHPVFSCDPWAFEETDKLVGGFFDGGSEAFRQYARNVFMLNATMFSGERRPFTVECRSDRFLALWDRGERIEDVFGRMAGLGGPVTFAYVDGAHAYEIVKTDVAGLDRHLVPGGFLLLDDSADGAGFEGVTRVAVELKSSPSYELVFKTPNYFFRKRR